MFFNHFYGGTTLYDFLFVCFPEQYSPLKCCQLLEEKNLVREKQILSYQS